MADTDFNELLHAAEQLSADVEGSGELPKVERTLRQVLEASTELWSRVTQTGAQDIQAHLLLGSKGVDLPQLSHKLEILSARKTFEPLEPTPDADIQSFLKNEKENAILSIIEETHQTCFSDIENLQWQHIRSEWKQEKQKALNALLGSSQGLLNIAVHPETSIMNDTVIGSKSSLDHQEMAYIAQVMEYNKAVVQGTIRPSLVEKLSQAANSLNDKKIDELWEMVRYMVNIPPKASGDPLVTRSKPDIQNILIFQARKYLEERYKKYMTSIVMGHLNQARLGGVPGTYPLVRSFVGIRVTSNMLGLEDGEVDGRPFWPLIYYCLRCGDTAAALHCAQQAGPGMEELCSILEEINNSRVKKLSPRLETLVGFQYRRTIRNTTDPFKRAVYCVIGSCDPNDEHSEIAKTADDYLWLKLCQIREEEVSEPKPVEKMSYGHLQSLILEEYGENHYNAMEQPHVYFQVLFLTGQFEAAVEFLSRIDKLRVHAVHIAIALNEHNLLGTPQHVQAPLLSVDPTDEPPARRLNLARLIMLYVRKFELTDPKEALQYYYFLRSVKGPQGNNLFMMCISDLALESREFDLLLGTLQNDGLHLPGLIHSFQGVQADSKTIIELVASDCERKGWYEDAIKLYDLANNHEKVLTLMTTLLSQVVHLPNTSGSLRWRLQQTADNIFSRYNGQQFSCSAETASMFFVLRDLLTFFDQYHAQEYQQALNTISKSRLIPLSTEEVEERVSSFRRLGDEICRTIPNILLATMNILYTQYKKIRGGDGHGTPSSSRFEDSSKDKQLVYLREKARAITSFAGTVPYRMPGDTNGRLVQMEILMN